ncbi:MAG: hypothetical protein LQ346_006089 [Caloplaca aetnensis]|nr:MAG: hypothetical protein LQ346_006089 [Caloplaca aetnensis]
MPVGAGDRLRRCPHCLLTRDEFHLTAESGKGLFAKHCNVCLGTTPAGQPVHDTCILCGHKIVSDSAALSHYRSRHDIKLTQALTASDLLHEYHPEQFPDLDLHNGYGMLLTRQDVLRKENDARVGSLALRYHQTPALIAHDQRDILEGHREAYFQFFDCDAISLHGHVSDAMNACLHGSLIQHLRSWSSALGHSDPMCLPQTAPQLAVMDGAYGAGYGPLAYSTVVARMRDVACGIPPPVVDMNPHILMDQVGAAKEAGCVALLVEVVRSRDGRPMPPGVWQVTVEACRTHGLFLIVDEALSAIRCGAPFAHQLPEYRRGGRPDLVLFGKGVRTCGVAVDWEGVNMKGLAIEQRGRRVEVILD